MLKKSPFYNINTSVECVRLLKKIKTNVDFKDFSNIEIISSIKSPLVSKDFFLKKIEAFNKVPISHIRYVDCFIEFKKLSLLYRADTIVKLKFNINKNYYTDLFSEFILENIENLYTRITNLYNQIILYLSKKGSYAKDTYQYTEELFLNILTILDSEYHSYSEITDEFIIKMLLKNFRTK